MKKKRSKKICIVLGTRPEIIKLSPVIKECKKRRANFFIIHTNQHYSFELDTLFFRDLNLAEPKYNLNIGSGNHGEMTGNMLIKLEKILTKEKPDVVLVQGDTNSVLAGALCAAKLRIPVGHIEAGLRSFDRNMPEETNRIITDHIAVFLFAPTSEAKKNLIREGINQKKIFNVGNTVVDALLNNLSIAKKSSSILVDMKLTKKEYSILTVHRPSNTDNKKNIKSILSSMAKASDMGAKKIIFLAHPRVSQKIKEYKIKIPKNITKIKPVGYFDMLLLMGNSKMIFTDSGGIQEEACILNIPCITLRDNTERLETVLAGANILTGCDESKILKAIKKMLKKEGGWRNPFGDGKSATRIINILEKRL